MARSTAGACLPLLTASLATVLLYWPVLVGLAADWTRFSSQSHGFAIPVIAAFLIGMRRRAIAAALSGGPPAPSPAMSHLGVVILIAALGGLVVGSLTGETFPARISLPIALLGLVLFLVGPHVLRHLWVGVAYLFFMVPLPYLTMRPLVYQSRLFEAGITAAALRLLGVPIFQDGVMLHLPNLTVEVAEECSSIPAIAALTALGIAYANLQPRPAWARIVLALGAAPLGLAANIARLILTVLAAYLFGPIALDNVIHRSSGTTVFLATILLLLSLDRLLTRLARGRG